ncbi:hypothetical protein MMC31_005885 [Peltigera leucophlebia]|nr:hypothetical protein [Peltigera leucophlebia]
MSFTFSWALWGFGALAVFVAKEVYWEVNRRRMPASIAWVGPRDEVFSMFRAWMRELTAGLKTVEEGYNKYNTKGKPFAILDTAGRSHVILPKELMRWLVSQKADIFSQEEVRNTRFAVKYLIPPVTIEMNEGFMLALRRDLTRNLGRTQKTVFDVLRLSLDSTIERADTSWHEIDLVAVLKPAITNAMNRIIVGQDLSGNETFLKTFEKFNDYLGLGSVVIGQYVPYFLTAPLGYLASITVRLYRRKALKYLVPEVQARMDAIQLAKRDPASGYKPPVDIIQWSIGTCKNASARDVSDAILSTALAATHTTIMTSTSTFVDILNSPPELGYFDAIHDEAVSVFQTEEDWGKQASLHKLSRTDSALRESMRLNPLFGRGTMQQVMHKNGVTLPDGNRVPQGQWLGVSLTGINQDERYYPDPHKYNPWRFSQAREEIALKHGTFGSDSTEPVDNDKPDNKVDNDKPDNKPNGSYLSTSEDRFAPFGFGKHSWYVASISPSDASFTSSPFLN